MADETVYSAGNLSLEILGVSDSAIASIDRTVKSLNALSRSITKVNEAQFVFAGDKLELLFKKISNATNSINTKNLDNLTASAKALSSISKIGNLSNIDYGKVSAGFSQLSTAITPFINKVKEAEASLTALYGILSKTNGKKLQNLIGSPSASSTRSSRGITGFLNLAKWTAVLYTARRLGRIVGDISQNGADYTETLNLWRVSMGQDLLPQATEFVNKMNEAYGVSEKTLMNAQAIFKNMLGSLGGITEQTSYALSEGITQMALDYASLYNQSFEDAFTKFQAALAGQVRPIRSVSGYDITETTLYEVYKSLGGQKTMRQLTQTEKRLLSIYAIFTQMEASNAVGDLNRTMESFANQSRVFADAWSDVKNYAGVLLSYVIQESGIFTKINAGLIFFSELLKGLATSMGAFKEFEDPFVGTEESANLASDAVSDLNSKLLEFDKFRALNQSEDNNAFGLDVKLLEALQSYKSILDNSNMEARKLANTWLENIRLIDKNNDGILDMQESIGAFNTRLSSIDFDQISRGFSNQTIKIINWFDDLIDGLSWDELGKNLGEFINGIDFYQIGVDVFDLAASLAGGIADALVTAFMEIDWWKLIKDTMSFQKKNRQSVMEALYLDWMIVDLTEPLGEFGELIRKWLIPNYNRKNYNIGRYADGGLPDKGSMFIAGEAGAEYVYNMSNGQSGVANVQQIAQATYNGTIKALNDWWGGSQARGDIPQLREANATGMYQAVTGVAKSYGQKWNNY